jgi:hypothetical protein
MRLALMVAVATGVLGAGPASPVGAYRLGTVDGVRVPMVWRESPAGEGSPVQLLWLSGRAEIRADGSFDLSLTSMRTGFGLPGTPETTTLRGTWHRLPGLRIDFRFDGGHHDSASPGARFSQLTLRVRYPDLEGQPHSATMVLTRN